MARMGHDSERAVTIYQHEARGADTTITSAIDAHVEPWQGHADDVGGASEAVASVGRHVNGTRTETSTALTGSLVGTTVRTQRGWMRKDQALVTEALWTPDSRPLFQLVTSADAGRITSRAIRAAR